MSLCVDFVSLHSWTKLSVIVSEACYRLNNIRSIDCIIALPVKLLYKNFHIAHNGFLGY